MKKFAVVLAAALLAATQSISATLDYSFSDTPLDQRNGGASELASRILDASVTDTGAGTVSFSIANNGKSDVLATVFFADLSNAVFGALSNAKNTLASHRFAQAFGVTTGTRFVGLNLAAGTSFSVLTDMASGLSAMDFMDIDLGVLLVEGGTNNSSIFGAEAIQRQTTGRLTQPATSLSAVPLPAGILLLGSGIAALCIGRGRARRKA